MTNERTEAWALNTVTVQTSDTEKLTKIDQALGATPHLQGVLWGPGSPQWSSSTCNSSIHGIWQHPSVYPSLSRSAEDATMQGLQWRHLQSARTDHSLLWQKHRPQLHVITNTIEQSEKLSCIFCESSYKGSFERRAVTFRLPQFGGLWCKRYLFGVRGEGCKKFLVSKLFGAKVSGANVLLCKSCLDVNFAWW